MDGMSPNSLEKQLNEQTTQLRLLEAAWRAKKDLQQAENARLREQYQEAERARQAQIQQPARETDAYLRRSEATLRRMQQSLGPAPKP